jgi:hypothetical protein
VKPPTQLTQQDVLLVAWLSSDANGTSKTLLLTIATQSWHPLGTRFAEEQQSFAEIGVVDFTESKPTVDIIKRWNGNLPGFPVSLPGTARKTTPALSVTLKGIRLRARLVTLRAISTHMTRFSRLKLAKPILHFQPSQVCSQQLQYGHVASGGLTSRKLGTYHPWQRTAFRQSLQTSASRISLTSGIPVQS